MGGFERFRRRFVCLRPCLKNLFKCLAVQLAAEQRGGTEHFLHQADPYANRNAAPEHNQPADGCRAENQPVRFSCHPSHSFSLSAAICGANYIKNSVFSFSAPPFSIPPHFLCMRRLPKAVQAAGHITAGAKRQCKKELRTT